MVPSKGSGLELGGPLVLRVFYFILFGWAKSMSCPLESLPFFQEMRRGKMMGGHEVVRIVLISRPLSDTHLSDR